MIGRRLPDTPHDSLPDDIQSGDYWKEDGTISVRPGDGSSNSILISRGDRSFHGYIEHGEWSTT